MTKSSTTTGGGNDSFWFRYVLSCCAATVAETATYPLDMVKTRLQIQGENEQRKTKMTNGQQQQTTVSHSHTASSTKKGASTSNVSGRNKAHHAYKRGMFSVTAGIIRDEGFFKLWQGCAPAVVRHYVYTGVRIVTYETMREKIFKHEASDEDGSFPLWEALCAGMASGVISQFLASPTDLVKVQMQMEGIRKLQGLPPRVTNMYQAFKMLLAEGGVKGLWKGWVPNCQRAALVNMADLSTYDKVKHTLLRRTRLKDNYVVHCLSSVCSGLMAAIASTPADVVKTRIMNQPTDKIGRGLLYKSSADCLFKTVKNEGFFALYKGFVPIWARMAPWSLTFWVSYEKIRRLTGVASF